jgi:transcriptional regulator with XRE-family HTH domain
MTKHKRKRLHPIARFRKDTGVSRNAFARKLKTSQSYLLEIEAGKKSPSLEFAQKIVKATGGLVTLDQIANASQG